LVLNEVATPTQRLQIAQRMGFEPVLKGGERPLMVDHKITTSTASTAPMLVAL
jgi:hypothetical protein